MTPPTEFSISAVLLEMKRGAKRNQALLVRVTLLFAVLSSAVFALEFLGPGGFALSLGAGVLLGAAYSGLIAALLCLPAHAESGAELLDIVRPVLARLVWASLLVSVAVLAGLIFLVVPGLILLTIWSVVIPVLVVEKMSVSEGLARSRALVRGNGWAVFVFLILLGIGSAIVLLLAYLIRAPLGSGILSGLVFQFLIACLVNPITAVGPAALYNRLREPVPEPPPEDIEPFAPH